MAFNLREIVAALDEAEVEYVVVGGLAVILHGYLRATADLDLAVGLSADNARRAMQALSSVGLQPRLPVPMADFANAAKRDAWARERNMQVFPLWDPANPLRSVDVFIGEPVAFADLFRDAVMKDLDGVPVRIASIAHLIEMKQGIGRPRDLEDIAALRRIREDVAGYHP